MAPIRRGGIKWLVAILAGAFLGGRGVLGLLGLSESESPWTDIFFCAAAVVTGVLFVVFSRREARRAETESKV